MNLFSAPIQKFELRPYQWDSVNGLRRSVASGKKRVILVSPTGSGKTITVSEMIRSAVEKGSHVQFWAHRRELITQCSNKLDAFGVSHGIFMAGFPYEEYRRVQVVSVPTLWSRVGKRKKIRLPSPDLIIVDETHRALSMSYTNMIEYYDEAVVIGITATPVRGDGRGLGEIYDDMVIAPSIGELTDKGWLVPCRYFTPSTADLTGLRVNGGDYTKKSLGTWAERNSRIVGDVVENFSRICPERKALVFCASRKHAKYMYEAFTDAGYKSAYLDGETETDERDRIVHGIEHGDIQVICNCMVLTEGTDLPSVSCCILARPTKSLGLYLQMAGRVVRSFPGKEDSILIDHVGAVLEHGPIDEPVEWSLDETTTVYERREKQRKKKQSKQLTCPECDASFSGRKDCPECGFVFQVIAESPEIMDAALGEYKKGKGTQQYLYSHEEKMRWYGMLCFEAKAKGYKPAWAKINFKEKFGHWPNYAGAPEMPPDKTVRAWIRFKHDEYRRQKEQERRAV